MVPALLLRFWPGLGVRSVAWVPAWPTIRLTPPVVFGFDLSAGIPGLWHPPAVPSRSAWPGQEAGVSQSGGQRVHAIPQSRKG